MPIVYKSGLLPLDAPAGKPLVRALVASMLVFGALASGAAHAQNAAMIEAGNQELRDDVQWLVDRGIIGFVSTSTWPIPVSVLETALEARKKTGLTRADVNAILAVRRHLDDNRKTRYGVTLQLNTDSVPQLGFASQSRAAATGGLYMQGGNEVIAGKLQVNGLLDPLTSRQSQINLEGSYVSGRLLGQALYVGQLAHFWGPGVDGSLNWGNAGTAIPGIGLQRAKQTAPESKWLSWVGPWGYDVFLGQLQHDRVVPRANIVSMRVFARPAAGFELGASRLIQWGGQGRSNSLGSLWRALAGDSNEYGQADPSNELSGFDVRYTLPLWGNPLTIYGQLAGEDEAGGLPSHYLAQFGMQFKHSIGAARLQWHAEAADTTARRVFGLGEGMKGTAYRHHIYEDGLYHDGLPIAHFIGGTGRLLSAGLTIAPDDFRYFSRYSVRLLSAQVNATNQKINEAFPKSDSWQAAELAVAWRLRPISFRSSLIVMHSNKNSSNNGISIMFSMNMPLQ